MQRDLEAIFVDFDPIDGIRYELLRVKGVYIGLREGFERSGLRKAPEGRFDKGIIDRRAALKERNVRVEAGKAWEVSFFRKASIAVVTYIIAVVAMYFVGINDYFTNAIKIPAAGALLFSDNRFATLEPGEPVHAGVASVAASLWWN